LDPWQNTGKGSGRASGSQNRTALARHLQGEYQWLPEDVIRQVMNTNDGNDAATRQVLDMMWQ
jgi:hypothetical protein